MLTDSFVTETLEWVKYRGDDPSNESNSAVALEDLLYEFFQANESSSSPRANATYLVKCADYDAADDFTFEELTYEQLANAYFMPGTATMDADGEYEDQIVVMTGETEDGKPSNDESSLRLKLPVTIEVTW